MARDWYDGENPVYAGYWPYNQPIDNERVSPDCPTCGSNEYDYAVFIDGDFCGCENCEKHVSYEDLPEDIA